MRTTNRKEEQFVLGTAQLGMDYGIANKLGKPDMKTAEAIVKYAWQNNIREFDTAQAYGESELVLGKILKDLNYTHEAKIITKPDPNIDYTDCDEIRKSIDRSIKKLGVSSLYCYMLHREELLGSWNNKLGATLRSFIKKDLIKHIGISVYSPEKAIEALNIKEISFIQIPSNIIDRRFESAGVFEIAKKRNKVIYIRSIFLQGLLLMDINMLPEKMKFAVPILNKIRNIADSLDLTNQELSIAYIKNAYPEAKLIFGIETEEQIHANLNIILSDYPVSIVDKIKKKIVCNDEKLLNPSKW